MRKYFILYCLLLTINIYSQDYIKNDTINISNKSYTITHISYGKSSLTKFYKVFTCDSKYKLEFIKKIIDCYKKQKLEYSEFYIIFIPKINSLNNDSERKIIISYLDKIDSERMKLNLSTTLIKCKYDLKNNKYEYLLKEPKESVSNIKNLFLKCNLNQVCECLKR